MYRLLSALTIAACLAAAEQPDLPGWGAEPVETSGAQRATICLNGTWLFRPGARARAVAWGEIRVPGAWARGHVMPGLVRAGAGPGWEGLDTDNRSPAWRQVDLATYARRLAIPADWAGRRITLDLRRVGTNARIFLDGAAVGAVVSPAGTVDLTAQAKPGTSPWLEVEVQAAAAPGDVTVFMGTAADQVFTRKAELRNRGLIGDVLLTSAPAGAQCSDVFVRPSVRRQRVDLDLEFAGLADGEVAMTARMLGPDGRGERTFTGVAQVAGGRASIGWPWADPRRWDLGRPELYILDLELSAPGFADRVQVEFGFKELWIEGRRLLLNGSEFHPRPYALVNECDRDWGQSELIDGAIAGLRGAGFDCQELWPWDQAERGVPAWHELWYERAKRLGWGMIAPLQDTRQILGRAWQDPAKRAAWEAAVRAQVRRDRNNPAILMWVHTPNVYGTWNDQDPRLLGMQSKLGVHYMQQGLEANAFVRALDPTRPVTTHHGGAVGDIHTANTYPCLAQPQEQAEWISHWAQHGEVPYWAIEFGPFVLDYRRGRLTGGWGQPFGAIHTELQATEQLAAWYGRAAYAAEPKAQRELNPKFFDHDQVYRRLPDSWHAANPLADRHMAEQLLGVFRAWRTMGTAFSPLPWEAQWGWDHSQDAAGRPLGKAIPAPAFVPGRRGLWFPELPLNGVKFLQPEGSRPLARPAALVAANGPVLAWICAPPRADDPGAIAARDHAVAGGGSLEKAVALLNDSRAEAAFAVRWRVLVAGSEIATGAEEGTLATGTRRFVPVTVRLPATARPLDGEIVCEATIGGRACADRFAFRVHPAPEPVAVAVQAIDPAGASQRLFAGLGATASDAAPVRLIGRRALSDGGVRLAEHEAWVRGGGRLLIMGQDPAWLRRVLGWRVGYQVLRRVFPVDPAHPVLAGLDELDLRDWSGAGTLVEAYPELSAEERGQARYPVHLWHWGNRGSVCSAPIEKPHRSAWRPLLECDFDLAWTPLMELDWGKGRVTWCQLDLEDRDDPAARRLAANLLAHVATAPLRETAGSVRFIGDAAERAFLVDLGLEIGERGPLVAGRGAEAQAAAGCTVALAAAPLGLSSVRAEAWAGAQNAAVPAWPELRGLSPADLRRSADGPQELLPETAGWERTADGLLARRDGTLLCLADPRVLPADEKSYFRFARWRLTRTLCQILANAGAGFAADRRLWTADPQAPADPDAVDLRGDWSARLTAPLPAAKDADAKHPEAPASAAARAAAAPDFDDAAWERHPLPGEWSTWGGAWAASDGEAVFRRVVEVEADFAARPAITLELGPIDDVDRTWVNGVEVGHTGTELPEFWKRPRSYRLPPGLLKPGRNVIVIAAQDLYGGAKVGDTDHPFRLVAPTPPRRDGWYWPDEERRHEVADDPHRYYRW